MLKYIVLPLLGIYLGMTFKDQIEEVVIAMPLKEAQAVFEDVKEQVRDQADELSKKFDEYSK